MKLRVIFVRDMTAIWVVNAWDHDSMDENPQGWEEALEKARADHPDYEVRLMDVVVPWSKVDALFDIPEVSGVVVEQDR